MLAACRLDQLAANADARACLSQAALDHVAHAELAGNLLDIRRLALVAEACVARHDGEPAGLRQFGDQILGETVEKELRLGVAAEVLEGQHGDAWLFRRRRDRPRAGRIARRATRFPGADA